MITQELEEVLITSTEIDSRIKQVAKTISMDYGHLENTPLVLGVLTGCIHFYSDLTRRFKFPIITEFMAVSSYGDMIESTGRLEIIKDIKDSLLLNRDVLIVEDIVDTGLTLIMLKQMLISRGAKSVKIVTLLDKPAKRKFDIEPDYCCFKVPDKFVVGYGLDYKGLYRNLPYVGVLKEEIYKE